MSHTPLKHEDISSLRKGDTLVVVDARPDWAIQVGEVVVIDDLDSVHDWIHILDKLGGSRNYHSCRFARYRRSWWEDWGQ